MHERDADVIFARIDPLGIVLGEEAARGHFDTGIFP